MLLGKSSDRKIPWTQLLVEAILVVFSVLLALGIRSCRNAQEQEALARQALQNFEREIKENKTEIESNFDYHKDFLDSLRSENPPTGINLRSPNIQNNAWEAAQNTGAISYIDFSIIETASKIEEVQSQYQNFLRTSTEIVMSYNFQSGLEAQRISYGLKSIMTGVVNYENTLLKLYDEALNKMNENPSED